MSPTTLWTLYKREIRGIFVSPTAYIVLFGCALAIGACLSVFLQVMLENNIRGYSLITAFFCNFPFWILVMVQTPLIAMRVFSEEYKLGTIEMLLTAPVREWEVVLAKFLAVLSFYIVLWLPVALDISYLYTFSNQKFDLSTGMVLLPLMMVLLLGAFYVAVGIFASALTSNQIVAAILGFAFIFILTLCAGVIGSFNIGEHGREFVAYISSTQHMETACRGLFDSRPLVFYTTGTVFFLFLTQRVLEARRLRS